MKHRIERVQQEILREVTSVIRKNVKDPRVQDVTITDADLTGDLSQATIYYSILSDKASDNQKVEEGLKKSTGLIRREVGRNLTTFKVPELVFKKDDSVAYGAKIDSLIRQLNQKD
ncbi:30S ribosome-binding factor RbfA [Holzapfeliella floricola]|uniref:Ribosome-binding factor A n=1 Tax=Holzapfeliella floricola DSM 23037 = JCM 16512 TaxID=1423744 RepID=A0A0R2DI77_9LACO|nr:30S ribosome-binding factor RbfA [Holzapfeliella floricola]KRN03792.1 hypothetical protein FC86_GL000904 [Holzapfeliella floricola DSM 23037 = JCM 16512]